MQQDLAPDAGTSCPVACHSPSFGQRVDEEKANTADPLVIGLEDPRFES